MDSPRAAFDHPRRLYSPGFLLGTPATGIARDRRKRGSSQARGHVLAHSSGNHIRLLWIHLRPCAVLSPFPHALEMLSPHAA